MVLTFFALVNNIHVGHKYSASVVMLFISLKYGIYTIKLFNILYVQQYSTIIHY